MNPKTKKELKYNKQRWMKTNDSKVYWSLMMTAYDTVSIGIAPGQLG
jgi:hypothetical protein